jgi:hypothetical protein
METIKESAADEVIGCLLSEREQAIRADELGRDLFRHVEAVAELTDGYAYRFPAGKPWAEKVIAFVGFERRCCPFATYELAFEPHQGPVWLRVRGSAAVKQFVREHFVPLGLTNATLQEERTR